MVMEHQRVRATLVHELHEICEKLEIGGLGNSFDYDLERLLNYVRAQDKEVEI